VGEQFTAGMSDAIPVDLRFRKHAHLGKPGFECSPTILHEILDAI
jgi:hypothetical protein